MGRRASRGPPGPREGEGWEGALVPWEVAHPLSTPWSPGRCCRSIFGNFLDLLLCFCLPTRCYEKMPPCHGCGGSILSSVGPIPHCRVLSQLFRLSVASQNLASRLFLLHHIGPYHEDEQRSPNPICGRPLLPTAKSAGVEILACAALPPALSSRRLGPNRAPLSRP